MHQQIKKHFDQALLEFTTGDYYDFLLEAKKEYFELTGKAQEEDDDYESRMNSFNDWYILHYISKDGRKPPIETYLEKNHIQGEIKQSFLECNHSLFEYTGTSFSGLHTLKDILHDKKITLAKDHVQIPLIKGDHFLGRTLLFAENTYLMNGLRTLPKEASSILKKEAKVVRKLKSPGAESDFLISVNLHQTKWHRYSHLSVDKVFVFSK